jgi:hypothetical protein
MDEIPLVVSVRDPLSEVTRKERRSLLALAATGLFIAKANLVPTKISALGIDFDQADQTKIKQGIALLIGYLVVAFSIYAWSDFLAWRYQYADAVRQWNELRAKEQSLTHIGDEEWRRAVQPSRSPFTMKLYQLATPTSVLRASFEFVLPVVIGIYALCSLI